MLWHTLKTAAQIKKQVAIHEASHAVAAYCLNLPFDYVTADPGNEFSHLGWMGCVKNVTESKNFIDNLIVDAAGYFGEQIFKTGSAHISEGARIDFETIDKAIIAKYGRESLTAKHKELMDETNKLLSKNSDKIQLLAEALQVKNTLTYNEVEKLFQ